MDSISQTTFSNVFLFNENVWISINISLKFIPKGQISNIPALVQIMAWHPPGIKQLSEPMMVQFTDAYMRNLASMSWQYYLSMISDIVQANSRSPSGNWRATEKKKNSRHYHFLADTVEDYTSYFPIRK